MKQRQQTKQPALAVWTRHVMKPWQIDAHSSSVAYMKVDVVPFTSYACVTNLKDLLLLFFARLHDACIVLLFSLSCFGGGSRR